VSTNNNSSASFPNSSRLLKYELESQNLLNKLVINVLPPHSLHVDLKGVKAVKMLIERPK
jgi:hypothetical protein